MARVHYLIRADQRLMELLLGHWPWHHVGKPPRQTTSRPGSAFEAWEGVVDTEQATCLYYLTDQLLQSDSPDRADLYGRVHTLRYSLEGYFEKDVLKTKAYRLGLTRTRNPWIKPN